MSASAVSIHPPHQRLPQLLLHPTEAVVGVAHYGELDVWFVAEGFLKDGEAAGDAGVAGFVVLAVGEQRGLADAAEVTEARLARELHAVRDFEEGEDVVVAVR